MSSRGVKGEGRKPPDLDQGVFLKTIGGGLGLKSTAGCFWSGDLPKFPRKVATRYRYINPQKAGLKIIFNNREENL